MFLWSSVPKFKYSSAFILHPAWDMVMLYSSTYSGLWHNSDLLSHVLQLFWVILRRSWEKKGVSRLSCMSRVWPQGLLSIWHVQEASWSDAQTSCTGSFHCIVAAMYHQTGHTSLSTGKSGQIHASCGAGPFARAELIKIDSQWIHQAHATHDFLLQWPERLQFWPANTSLQIQGFIGLKGLFPPISAPSTAGVFGFHHNWPQNWVAATAMEAINMTQSGGSWEPSHLVSTFPPGK